MKFWHWLKGKKSYAIGASIIVIGVYDYLTQSGDLHLTGAWATLAGLVILALRHATTTEAQKVANNVPVVIRDLFVDLMEANALKECKLAALSNPGLINKSAVDAARTIDELQTIIAQVKKVATEGVSK
jgi:hypothetical protein